MSLIEFDSHLHLWRERESEGESWRQRETHKERQRNINKKRYTRDKGREKERVRDRDIERHPQRETYKRKGERADKILLSLCMNEHLRPQLWKLLDYLKLAGERL